MRQEETVRRATTYECTRCGRKLKRISLEKSHDEDGREYKHWARERRVSLVLTSRGARQDASPETESPDEWSDLTMLIPGTLQVDGSPDPEGIGVKRVEQKLCRACTRDVLSSPMAKPLADDQGVPPALDDAEPHSAIAKALQRIQTLQHRPKRTLGEAVAAITSLKELYAARGTRITELSKALAAATKLYLFDGADSGLTTDTRFALVAATCLPDAVYAMNQLGVGSPVGGCLALLPGDLYPMVLGHFHGACESVETDTMLPEVPLGAAFTDTLFTAWFDGAADDQDREWIEVTSDLLTEAYREGGPWVRALQVADLTSVVPAGEE